MANFIKPIKNSYFFGLIFLLTAISGCSHNPISTTTAYVLEGIVEEESLSFVFASDDPDTGCHLGQSFDYFLGSVNVMTDSNNKYLPMIPTLSSLCSEYKAREAELRSIRALNNRDVAEAKDARSLQQYWLAKTAERRLKAFNIGMKVFEYETGDNEWNCPMFDESREEVSFMLTLVMGSLAIKNDAESGMAVGVPRNIASTILEAADCLDNRRWGGAPQALQALLWLLLPDKKPADITKSNWEILEYANRSTVRVGNRLGSGLHAVAAEVAGNKEQTFNALAIYKQTIGNPIFEKDDYRIVDQVATRFIREISNVLWTSEVGYRTPFGQLGALPPTLQETDDNSEDLDSLL